MPLHNQVNELVSSLLSDVSSRASSSLQPLADESLQTLFSSLDTNSNGQISFEEFKGTSVQSWAAMHTIANHMPSVDDALRKVGALTQELPPLPSYDSPLSTIVFTWIYYLFLVQLVLGTIEHLRYWFGLRCLSRRGQFPTDVDLDHPPTHVSNQEAVPWHDTPQNTCYARFKTILMVTSGLAPLRLIQGVILFVCGVVTLNISNIVPLRLWRKFWLLCVKWQIYGLLASMG